MGGSGSGSAPRSRRRTTDRAVWLDVADLTRAGAFVGLGTTVRAASLTLTHGGLWPEPWRVAVEVRADGEGGAWLTLGEDAAGRVRLEATAQPFGGVRWWARCARCGGRCRVLYLQPARPPFTYLACRRCAGLDYRSQRQSAYDRWTAQAEKIHARIGAPAADGLLYPAKGMHRRTFDRLMDRADAYEDAAAGVALAALGRIAERWGWRAG